MHLGESTTHRADHVSAQGDARRARQREGELRRRVELALALQREELAEQNAANLAAAKEAAALELEVPSGLVFPDTDELESCCQRRGLAS